jgi:hypothetical protein
MSKLIYLDYIKGGRIWNAWEQAVKEAIDDNDTRIEALEGGGSSGSVPDFIVTGGTVSYQDISMEKIVKLGSSGTFTLPLISSLPEKWFAINIINISGDLATVIPNGGNTIDGETSQTVGIGENMKIFINGTDYKIY